MNIPKEFDEILKTNQTLYSIVLDVITSFEHILNDNKLFFFEEYTDHGINHIEQVLEASAKFIITQESFKHITSNEIAILVLAIILHDLGMHMELSTFNNLLNGEYDSAKIDSIDDRTWRELWDEYLSEVKRFSSIQKKNIFGNEEIPFKIPDLSNKDNLNGYDKKLIGEFIRRYHGRFAHEVSLLGLKGNEVIPFGNEKIDEMTRQLTGILARSHSMNVRDTFAYLKDIAHQTWRNPQEINIIYLMIIIRLADYIQIDKSRVSPFLLKLKTFNSPISQLEHNTHLSITSLNFVNEDPEKILVTSNPKNSEEFIKIKNLILDIQNEFDKSWAILGEVYGFLPNNKPSIKFRRISSNLEEKDFTKKLNYVPQQISFKVDNNLSKLLVAPLYGENPTFGVRELLQNAIDSCLERKEFEYQMKNYDYKPSIKVSLNRIDEESSLFTISDNGKGMNDKEIINYFLNVGTSFRKSMDWKKQFVDENGKSKVSRNGKFGIGVLASFLLGENINVTSTSLSDSKTYTFTAGIESQFVNVSKSEKIEESGVKISIIVDNDKRTKLLTHYYKITNWNNWYIYDDPEIIFTVDDKIIKNNESISLEKCLDFSTNDFENISWYYGKRTYTYSSTSKMIACNGIIITNDYSPSSFTYKNHTYKYLIKYKPNLLITDKEGIFPVKLDRNAIDCKEFPFESELLAEVSKHFVAKLLTVNIDLKNLNKTRLIHEPFFLYSEKGFILNSDFFIEQIRDKYDFIKIITSKNNIEINFSEYKETFFSIVFNENIKLTNQQSNVAPDHGGRILLSKYYFENLFKTSKKRLPKYAKNNISIVEENEKYVIYDIYNYKSKSNVISQIFQNDFFLSQIESIQEVSPKIFNLLGGDILNNIFAKYIKRNCIIPYDIEERRILYKEAFRELEYYI